MWRRSATPTVPPSANTWRAIEPIRFGPEAYGGYGASRQNTPRGTSSASNKEPPVIADVADLLLDHPLCDSGTAARSSSPADFIKMQRASLYGREKIAI